MQRILAFSDRVCRLHRSSCCANRRIVQYDENQQRFYPNPGEVFMTTLILELQPDLYDRLAQETARPGRPVETLVEEWLERRFPPRYQRHREALLH
ncbi:hypothetical protein RoseRS_3042 [Roseiflexus sp. RS-1]|nr:hypothetical protein RoseRS_3042 [Roseiflexus sp. RS-1]